MSSVKQVATRTLMCAPPFATDIDCHLVICFSIQPGWKKKKKTFSKDSSLLARYLHLVALPSLSDRTLRMNRLTWLFQSKYSGTTLHRQDSYADIDTLINEILIQYISTYLHIYSFMLLFVLASFPLILLISL